VTNHHVVEAAEAMKVVLSDRREFDAKLVLDDPRADLAVLRIDVKNEKLPTLAFADTHKLDVGDLVIAIGNPFGLSQTVTNGIISALGRTGVGDNGYGNFIQTDASINSGNSGGALVDMNGDLVGINTAILSPSGTSAGIGFAIPADMVKRVVESAMAGGKVVRPWLGVHVQPVTQDTARALGLSGPKGVLVAEVYPGGPGAKAGIAAGDVILAINGTDVFEESGVRYQTATARPGDKLSLDIIKGSARRTVSVQAEAPPRNPPPDVRILSGRIPLDGAQIATLSPAEADDVGFDPMTRGVYIKAMAPNGLAAQVGLAPGDVIVSVNGKTIRTSAELETAVKAAKSWHIEFKRGGALRSIDV
jgi:Do/DeqQ family serine protease